MRDGNERLPVEEVERTYILLTEKFLTLRRIILAQKEAIEKEEFEKLTELANSFKELKTEIEQSTTGITDLEKNIDERNSFLKKAREKLITIRRECHMLNEDNIKNLKEKLKNLHTAMVEVQQAKRLAGAYRQKWSPSPRLLDCER
ncbi:MAG: hypothetical protein PWP65_303 [Clostridia bacterium]|nr:hypothetical protein [Clostridia bacterium]